ncbi:MAG: class I SAM-dependent methyltransferase [Nocardioides sp.]
MTTSTPPPSAGGPAGREPEFRARGAANSKMFRTATEMTRLEPGLQYVDESRLETRKSVWQPGADGRDPQTAALEAIGEHFMSRAHPLWHVLEIGCGTGTFAERVSLHVGADRMTLVDSSPRMVELAAERGLNAKVADVRALPFPDDSFDVVAALWMLYHVPDLSTAMNEIHRVLRPGGRFIAVTNSEEHLAELWHDAGATPVVSPFTSENGEDLLKQHFTRVQRTDLETRAVFDDHQAAVDYLATVDEDVANNLPAWEGGREYAGGVTIFVCSSTNHPVPEAGPGRRPRRVLNAPMRRPTGQSERPERPRPTKYEGMTLGGLGLPGFD